jgi:hypothetical protein
MMTWETGCPLLLLAAEVAVNKIDLGQRYYVYREQASGTIAIQTGNEGNTKTRRNESISGSAYYRGATYFEGYRQNTQKSEG